MSRHHDDAPAPVERRVAALEQLLTERGLVPPGFVDDINRAYEQDVGPMNGAKVVARAWVDPDYRSRLLTDATAAIAELGFGGDEGDHMRVCANTPTVHNVVVCTLCSCYPIALLGPSPTWYKSTAYRSRVVSHPREVLGQFGFTLPDDTEIRVWDATSEVRYLVLPRRPADTEHLTEDELRQLVTRNGLIGTAPV